jgi:hypothetical protein
MIKEGEVKEEGIRRPEKNNQEDFKCKTLKEAEEGRKESREAGLVDRRMEPQAEGNSEAGM